MVIGPPPKVNKDQVKREQVQTQARLSVLLERAQRKKKKVLWYDSLDKVVGTDYITEIKLDGEQYKVISGIASVSRVISDRNL